MDRLERLELLLQANLRSAEAAYVEARDIELSTEEATDSMEREYAAGYRDALIEVLRDVQVAKTAQGWLQ